MDSLDELIELVETPNNKKKSSSRGKKRKWREIEALKDKRRLQKELQELDIFADNIDVDDLDLT